MHTYHSPLDLVRERSPERPVALVRQDSVAVAARWFQDNLKADVFYAVKANPGREIIDLPIGMIVLGPYAKVDFTESTTPYTHGSLLRTLQDIFGVGPYMRDAALQQPLSNLFTMYP